MSTFHRTFFVAVIGAFTLMGVIYLLGGMGMIAGIENPKGMAPASLVDRIDGVEGIAFGIVYLITAFGLYRRISAVRILAAIILIWNLFGSLSSLSDGFDALNLLWFIATVSVAVWFFTAPAKECFSDTSEQAKTA